jgi:hypothetical protein
VSIIVLIDTVRILDFGAFVAAVPADLADPDPAALRRPSKNRRLDKGSYIEGKIFIKNPLF